MRRRPRDVRAGAAKLVEFMFHMALNSAHGGKYVNVTCEQIRMARARLGWSFRALAKQSKSARTIKRIESENGLSVVTPANLKLIITTLEAAGVEFVGGPGDGPGVRLWGPGRQA